MCPLKTLQAFFFRILLQHFKEQEQNNICAKFPICKMVFTRSPSSQSCVIILLFLRAETRHKSFFQTYFKKKIAGTQN